MSDRKPDEYPIDPGNHEVESEPHSTTEIPEWLRPTKWRVVWLSGVPGFIWWTASIYRGHERLLYFSPQSLGLEKQTRIVLLGTSIPIFTSDRGPDFSLPLLSDFLIDEGIWTPDAVSPKWYLIYHQYHPRKESWIFREFMRNQGTWVGWTLSQGGPWKVYRVFPEKLWAEILGDLRAAKDPLDESIGDKLRTQREAFPEDEVSGYQEASMSTDYYNRVKPIRERKNTNTDG